MFCFYPGRAQGGLKSVRELGIFLENPETYLIYHENEEMKKIYFFVMGSSVLFPREKAVICLNITYSVQNPA
jgi:hypothetical protein